MAHHGRKFCVCKKKHNKQKICMFVWISTSFMPIFVCAMYTTVVNDKKNEWGPHVLRNARICYFILTYNNPQLSHFNVYITSFFACKLIYIVYMFRIFIISHTYNLMTTIQERGASFPLTKSVIYFNSK